MSGLVVKIGGSLWRSRELADWMAALRRFPGPLTLVPGGGPFADAVRATQPVMGFSDLAAHHMALLAMEQYAVALSDRFGDLGLATTPLQARALHAERKIALWTPTAMTLAAAIPASWEITSDSLAAFFAREAGVTRLLLIKSVDIEDCAGSLVDPQLSAFARGLDVRLAGPRALAGAAQIFAQGEVVGARLTA